MNDERLALWIAVLAVIAAACFIGMAIITIALVV